MKLLPSNDSKELFINDIDKMDYEFSSNLFIRPNGYKHFLPVRYLHTSYIKSWENTLAHLERNKYLQWALISISDYEKCLGLKLIQWNSDILKLVIEIAPILQQIDLSNLNISSIPFELLNQFSTRLFSLNLSCNQIEMNIFKDFKSVYLLNRKKKYTNTSIKQDDCWIETLNEVCLNHNKLHDQFPGEILNYMTSLKRLYIQNNDITSIKGLNGLVQLRVLRADFNKITNLHDSLYTLKNIEYIYLSHNNISQLISGSRLKYLNHLRVIDLSYNNLSFLPAVIFNLPSLQTLKVDHNNICSLPTIRSISRISKESIELIDLSNNQINTISDGLLRITKRLDLSRNKLKIFPVSLLKMIVNIMQIRNRKPTEIIQLDLTDNPIIWPPSSIINNGINAMIQYYLESRIEIQSYYGIRTVFLGDKNCGKSSLTISLLDRQTHMTESLEEATYSIESYTIHYDAVELTSKITIMNQEDNNVNMKSQTLNTRPTTLTIWDCSGHLAYIPLISFFTSLPTIVTLLVDITKFQQNSSINDIKDMRNPESYFYKSIGIWLDIIIFRLNYSKVILLATKCDLISSEKELNEQLKNLYIQTLNYLKSRNFILKDQITRIESSLQISHATTQYYEHLNDIYENAYISLYPNIIPISLKYSKSLLINFDQLCYTLFDLAIKTPTHLPFCLTSLPQIWSDIEMYLDDIKHNYNSITNVQCSNQLNIEMNGCILLKSYFCHLLQNKFHLNLLNLKQLLTYLNNTGKILILDAFLSKEEENYLNSTMKSFMIRPYPKTYVIIDPDLFMESLKYLIHPNLLSIINPTISRNKNIHQEIYVPETFQKDLLRRFYSATRQGAINRLIQSCTELNKGTGIVSAYLWIALVEYSNLYVTKNSIEIGRSYVEILWRWLELAYPVPEPDLFINFNFESTGDTSSDEIKSPTWKFKYFPSPREIAVACGIISYSDQPSQSSENQSDSDESIGLDPRQSPTNDQLQSLICSERLPALCFPCLIPASSCSPMDEMSINIWETAGKTGPRPVIFVYRFSCGLPQELFDKATVRLNWPEVFKFRYTAHWKTGVQMFSSSNRVMLRFLLVKIPGEDYLIKFEFRALPLKNVDKDLVDIKSQSNDVVASTEKIDKGTKSVNEPITIPDLILPTDNNNTKRSKRREKCKWHKWPISEANLWDLMLPLLKEFDGILLAYKGLCYKRVMECPKCNELTLAGEWLTPREVQSVNYRKCPACAHRIPSCLLAPPENGLDYKRKLKSKRKSRKREKPRK